MKKRAYMMLLLGKIFLILVIAAVTTIIAGSLYLKSVANTKLKEFVSSSSDSLYQVEYASISMNLLAGSVAIYDLRLIPDTLVYLKLRRQHRAPLLIAEAAVNILRVENLRWWKFMRTKDLVANSVIIDAPNISLKRHRSVINDTISEVPLDLYHMLSREVKNLKIESVLLNDASISYEFNDSAKNRRALLNLEQLDVFIDNLHIDFIKAGDSTGNIFADNYLLRLENYRYRTADSLYWLVWKEIEYSSMTGKAMISSFSVEPRYSEIQFWPRVKARKERFDIELKNISVEGVHAEALIRDGEFRARRISVPDGNWEIFQNMSLPLPPVKKNICFSQKLMNVRFPLHVDTIHVSGVNFHFKEFNPSSGDIGHLTFENIKGNFLNVTNIAHQIKINPHFRVSLSAKFMDASRMSADFNFALNAPDGKFQVKAELEKLNAPSLNRATRPLAKLEVEQGTINKMIYRASGNDRFAKGTITFLYDDLKLNFLESEKPGGNLEKQGLKSWIAAMFVIKPQNPGKNDPPRQALNIISSRHPQKGFFNMLWKTLFSGIKEIILSNTVKKRS